MKLRASHIFSARAAAVCAGMADADFYAHLELPDLEPPELLVRNEQGPKTDLAPGITRRLDLEAAALDAYLTR